MSDRDPEQRLQIATHVVNNWAHDAWLGESGVLDGIDAIAHIPGHSCQPRCILCPSNQTCMHSFTEAMTHISLKPTSCLTIAKAGTSVGTLDQRCTDVLQVGGRCRRGARGSSGGL